MNRVGSLQELPRGGAVHLAVGTFDGVHRGHQAVLRAAAEAARHAGRGAVAAALTFTPHPSSVLHPERRLPCLTTAAERARLVAHCDVGWLVELPFDQELARVPAEAFAQEQLRKRGGVTAVFVGPTFRFGAGAHGTPETLAAAGLSVRVVGPVRHGGQPVSSTRVRAALAAGRPGLAAQLLGRRYELTGRVVRGQGLGGQLGFPTANVEAPACLQRPAFGVYAVRLAVPERGGRWLAGAANLGLRPTVAGAGPQPSLEVHALDWTGDLYGAEVRVAFVRRLRGERRFPGVDALARQIGRDVDRVRRLLGSAAGSAADQRSGWRGVEPSSADPNGPRAERPLAGGRSKP